VRPLQPQVGVGGVVVRDGRVLLVRRGKPPLEGRWSIPGGTVELGETLEQALVREMAEETGLEVEPLEVLTVFDRIQREDGDVVWHHVIVDYLCRRVSGEARAASDALEVAWAAADQLGAYELTEKALAVVADGFRLSEDRSGLRPDALARDTIPPGRSCPRQKRGLALEEGQE
jgi:8-oxo-dGTP diphosphatase